MGGYPEFMIAYCPCVNMLATSKLKGNLSFKTVLFKIVSLHLHFRALKSSKTALHKCQLTILNKTVS